MICAVARTHDRTVVLVTNEMDFALDFADKVLFLDQAVIIEQGTVSEVLKYSKNEHLQSFLNRFRKL